MTTLYRLYDEAGVLRYVGATSCLEARLAYHKQRKLWFHKVAKVETCQFEDKDAALEREAKEIKELQPAFNILQKTTGIKWGAGEAKRRNEKYPYIGCRFSDELEQRIRALAKSSNRSISSICKEMVLRGLPELEEQFGIRP